MDNALVRLNAYSNHLSSSCHASLTHLEDALACALRRALVEENLDGGESSQQLIRAPSTPEAGQENADS